MNLNRNILLFAISMLLYVGIQSVSIEHVDDSDLMHLLVGEQNVVVLFTKDKCAECDEWETVVENIQSDLKDTLDAVVVQAHNSHLNAVYDPSREPSLIFFRRGIPLLYYGQRNEEAVLHMFGENREPVVKELADGNFEHLTQAASGATTGDWFIFFYSADCVLCQRLYAVWESVGAKLKRRLNVARINRVEAGSATAKRFGITSSPEFIYLRQGKVYRYKSKEYTPKSFIEFAETGYRKQTSPEAVPSMPTFMDDFIASRLRAVLQSPQFLMIGAGAVLLLFLTGVVLRCLARKTQTEQTSKKAK